MTRFWRLARAALRLTIYAAATLLALIGLVVVVLETPWGNDQLRQLIVNQANRYLAGSLSIDRLDGSLLRGVRLDGVRVTHDGQPVVEVGHVSIGYSLRGLWGGGAGTTIREIELRQLRIVAERLATGRWNLASLLRPRPSSPSEGLRRPVRIDRVVISDAAIDLRSPVTFGAVRVPTEIRDLNAMFGFRSQPDGWTLSLERVSLRGREPTLTITGLSGGLTGTSAGLRFQQLHVETSRSAFTVDGSVAQRPPPTRLDLSVDAERFAFQEWGGVLPGLRTIAIESTFSTRLVGPPDALATTLDFRSNGGDVRGMVALDTTVPGWHGVGELELSQVNLAPWFSQPNRPSNITGRVSFDLDLELGRRFPRGRYQFGGPHVAYLGYEADDLSASGVLTSTEAQIARATAWAYGANLDVHSGSIGLHAPFAYRFSGVARGVDLRRVPPDVPLPHVDSSLSFRYDVRGRFRDPVIEGQAQFEPSSFLDVAIADGAWGTIDTSVRPIRYTGVGAISNVALQRLGAGLDVAWMRDPRYAGTIAGHFEVNGSGWGAAALTLDATGRLEAAELFQGTLSAADVSLTIADGSLQARYVGSFSQLNPAIALADSRLAASLSGQATLDVSVRELLTRDVTLGDYDISGQVTLNDTSVRGLHLTHVEVTGSLAASALDAELRVDAPIASGRATGTIDFGARTSRVTYVHAPLDLSSLGSWLDQPLSGWAYGSGEATGPLDALRVVGTTRVSLFAAPRIEAQDLTVDYNATVVPKDPWRSIVTSRAQAGQVVLADRPIGAVSGSARFDSGRMPFELELEDVRGFPAQAVGTARVSGDERVVDLEGLNLRWRDLHWRLAGDTAPRITWRDRQFLVSPMTFLDAETGRQRVIVSGAREADGSGQLMLSASGVFLDPLSSTLSPPGVVGGMFDGDATLLLSADGNWTLTGDGSVRDGRLRRLPFDRMAARVSYKGGILEIDGRFDQAPGVWLTAVGRVPLDRSNPGMPDTPINLALASSAIDLRIVEGVTDVVHGLSGQLHVNLTVLGTRGDPHFEGAVNVTDAAFTVRATGARYANAQASIRLALDRMVVEALRLTDRHGHTLTVSGSLGTHELKVGDLAIDVRSKDFEVLRNEFGTLEVDTDVRLRGQFESPKVTGTVTITGGALNVDRVLDRTLLRPYRTESTAAVDQTTVDALVALNPWDRLGLDIAVHTPGSLRMTGENVQVSPGTPLGLGNIALRAFGDIYLYKDPGQPLFVTGALDSLIGTYAFQGRRFEIDPASSVIFRGDLNPELYVTVRRTISAVETRVSIVGPLNEPELRLASTPSLDPSDILSLIVFNTTLNQLSTGQQQELAVRAGTLAAGFFAAPLVSALERSLGLDILEIEPPRDSAGGALVGPRVTVGDEIAPGLIARFSRQFGQQEYNEATIEYYLSRLFRIRATFSDAGDVLASRFRRVERAGIDFILFFSF